MEHTCRGQHTSRRTTRDANGAAHARAVRAIPAADSTRAVGPQETRTGLVDPKLGARPPKFVAADTR